MKKILAVAVAFAIAGALSAQSFNNPDKWGAFDDKGDKGDSIVKKESSFEERAGKNVLKVRLTGKVTTKFKYGFVGVTAEGDPATVKALQTGKGIVFKTVGDGKKYKVRVETSDVKDYDFYCFVFTAPVGTETEVVVPFEKLAQEGWGAKKKFNAANASKVGFQTVGQPHDSIDVTIIDLKVLQ